MQPAVDIKSLIRTIPDYPKPGILFRDITTLIADPAGLRAAIDGLVLPVPRRRHRPCRRHRGARLHPRRRRRP